MTELLFLTDSYKKEISTRVTNAEQKGSAWELTLAETVFYPQGGGQPSDRGTIKGAKGTASVKHVRMDGAEVVHECTVEGTLVPGDRVTCSLDWPLRYRHMRLHSAGHVLHEAVISLYPDLVPLKGEHGDKPAITYRGSIPIGSIHDIMMKANALVAADLPITSELVSLDELQKRVAVLPPRLPKNKPLRIITIGDRPPTPDGGTQVAKTGEVGEITVSGITNTGDTVTVAYTINTREETEAAEEFIPVSQYIGMLLEAQANAKRVIEESTDPREILRIAVLGPKSELGKLTKRIRSIKPADRQQAGTVVNDVKASVERAIEERSLSVASRPEHPEAFDPTVPGLRPPEGHLHIVTQAIAEITEIFARIGFTRVRHPEVDWDWYAFESLNMPKNHPARDEWETFFVEHQKSKSKNQKFGQIVLTPHTSNGQVREMEKGKLPIRMINIATCYRRQSDISHTPMFHQFEGMYIDTNVSIGHLKGVFDYFVKQFFGPDRTIRLRPFHFQFTEPSFEVDINCGICLGSGKLADGAPCRLCKSGWLEMAGGGMIHPTVLKNGGIDPSRYSGFAFGWGVERAYMMKGGTKLDDIRLIYSNDIRFLEQF
ncbi:phenylalanine--tRNA ligase subunit alpha [Patescibacteria group bacterium]|nr:phenylalanine--tRNA ligase subunit alpha [Patescibacteria group bacterium]